MTEDLSSLSSSPTTARLGTRPSLPVLTLATLPLATAFATESPLPAAARDDAATCLAELGGPVTLAPSVSADGERWTDLLRERDRELDLLRRVLDVLHVRGSAPPLGGDPGRAPPYVLRALRSRIVAELRDFDAWLAVMRAMQPEADGIEVPERFVLREHETPADMSLREDLDAALTLDDLWPRG